MRDAIDAIDAAIREVDSARRLVNRVTTKQVSGAETRSALKSTAYAWFHSHRAKVTANGGNHDLVDVNRHYTTVLESTDKYAAKQTYLDALRDAKKALNSLRSAILTSPGAPAPIVATDDLAPDFSPLAGNQVMRDVLTRRWHECAKCVKADAHLAAIVMMGGLLEALFVARANKLPTNESLVNAASAPRDRQTGRTQNYQDWMLDSYIKVGHELGWITDSAKQIADVLKEYRNYIHPAKELRHQVQLAHNDSVMLWQVTKALVRQLLMSASS
jgi:hypothetical protein